MAQFYGDIMREFNDVFNKKKNFFGDFPVILKFNTAPSEKVSLSQSYSLERTTDDDGNKGYQPKNVVTLKTKCSDNQVFTKFEI